MAVSSVSRGIWAAGVALLFACAHPVLKPAPPSELPAAGRTAEALLQSEVDALSRDVARLRDLSFKRSVRVVVLEDAAFVAAFAEKARLERQSLGARSGDYLLAFRYAGPEPLSPEGSTRLGEQIAGYYDELQHLMVMRTVAEDPNPKGLDVRRFFLVHELEHALQDQIFRVDALLRETNLDARRALDALYEGDAQLVALLDAAEQQHKSADLVLQQNKRLFRSASAQTLAQRVGSSPELEHAPLFSRESLLFPYAAGTVFAIDLYRAGGVGALNGAFEHPPVSTSEVLHPERYVAGAGPVRLGLTAGEHETSGTLGELFTRLLFERCLPPLRAEKVAAGWVGDSYVVSANARSFGWCSEWRDLDAAQRAEEAMVTLAGCWLRSNAAAPRLFVRRSGTRLAVTTVSRRSRQRVTRELLGVEAVSRREHAPLGPLTLPADPDSSAEALARHGILEGNTYFNRYLGVRSSVPEGLSATTASPGIELGLSKDELPLVVGNFTFLRERTGPADRERVFAGMAGGIAGGLDETHPLVAVGEVTPASDFPGAVARTWKVSHSNLLLRALVVPACSGRATLLFFEMWMDPSGETALRTWLKSFNLEEHPASPACQNLAPGVARHPSGA